MRDLDLVVSVAHRGGSTLSLGFHDRDANCCSRNVRSAGYQNVNSKSHAVVKGFHRLHHSFRRSVVHRLPVGACLVPVHGTPRRSLPFAYDDPRRRSISKTCSWPRIMRFRSHYPEQIRE